MKLTFFKLRILKSPPFFFLLEEVHTYRSDIGMSGSGRRPWYDGDNRPASKQSIVIGLLLVYCVLIAMKFLGPDHNK